MTDFPVFKIATAPRVWTDYTPLLGEAWHLVDFGPPDGQTLALGVVRSRSEIGRYGAYRSRMAALYKWAGAHALHVQVKTLPAPEYGVMAKSVYVRMIGSETYWKREGFPHDR